MKDLVVSILEPVLSIFVIGYTLIGFLFGGAIGTGAIFTLLSIRELLEQQLSSLRALERSRQP